MNRKLTDFFSKKNRDLENDNSTCDNNSSDIIQKSTSATQTSTSVPAPSSSSSKLSITEFQRSFSFINEQFQPADNFLFPKTASWKQQRSCQIKWFEEFSWLHYDIANDFVLCFTCNRAEASGQLFGEKNKDFAYVSKGFRSWKKAPKCFREHEQSKPHITATTYLQLIVPKCADVSEMLVEGLRKMKLDQRRYFIKVMECVQYLCRQGIPFLGSNDGNDNFTQLLLLRGKDNPLILEKLKKR